MIRHKPGNKIKTIPEPQKLSMTRTGKSLVNSGSFCYNNSCVADIVHR